MRVKLLLSRPHILATMGSTLLTTNHHVRMPAVSSCETWPVGEATGAVKMIWIQCCEHTDCQQSVASIRVDSLDSCAIVVRCREHSELRRNLIYWQLHAQKKAQVVPIWFQLSQLTNPTCTAQENFMSSLLISESKRQFCDALLILPRSLLCPRQPRQQRFKQCQ